MITRIFLHGLDSSPQGTKARYFAEHYKDMIIPHFTGNLEDRMQLLYETLKDKEKIILVGSSFGGLMSTIFAIKYPERCERLILLAPAINLLTEDLIPTEPIKIPTWIFHGEDDNVIPLESVKEISKRLFSDLRFYIVKDDHQLRDTFLNLEWDELLLINRGETKMGGNIGTT